MKFYKTIPIELEQVPVAFKIRVRDEEGSIKIQNHLLKLGYIWADGTTKVQNTDKTILYADEYKILSHSTLNCIFDISELPLVTLGDILSMPLPKVNIVKGNFYYLNTDTDGGEIFIASRDEQVYASFWYEHNTKQTYGGPSDNVNMNPYTDTILELREATKEEKTILLDNIKSVYNLNYDVNTKYFTNIPTVLKTFKKGSFYCYDYKKEARIILQYENSEKPKFACIYCSNKKTADKFSQSYKCFDHDISNIRYATQIEIDTFIDAMKKQRNLKFNLVTREFEPILKEVTITEPKLDLERLLINFLRNNVCYARFIRNMLSYDINATILKLTTTTPENAIASAFDWTSENDESVDFWGDLNNEWRILLSNTQKLSALYLEMQKALCNNIIDNNYQTAIDVVRTHNEYNDYLNEYNKLKI